MQVELVNVTTADGVRLDGYLRAPGAAHTSRSLGLDLVICHHGVGSNFYGASFFDRMGDSLLERGCAILRVNNRGHDQAFMSGQRRLGAAYEIVDECHYDVVAWLDFAQERGFGRIGLWGHSLGAVKTIYFLGTRDDARVLCAIASSPPRFSYAAYRESAEGAAFQLDVAQASAAVGAGRPEEILDAAVPVVRRFSARTYIDKYGPEARYDYLAHLPNVRKPLLLTLGSLEADELNFAPLAEQGPAFAARWPQVAYREIAGADHSYSERTAQLWTDVQQWLTTAAGLTATAGRA